jgi:ubiquinone/menaquinone biosynthesis C-methylase UbiE
MNIFSILQSPDDGTPIGPDLMSEGGVKYEMTESGVLLLDSGNSRPSDIVYASAMFEKWDSIVSERIKYYTGKESVAGLLANWTYRCIRHFNERGREWLLDIGCGDGAHVAHLKDRSTYIGLDRNIKRLEIMKDKYPEVTAIYGDATSLPFRSDSLKHVFSCNAFEHVWYLKDAVIELYRCAAKNGALVIVVPTEGGLWSVGRRVLSKPHFQKLYPDIDFEFISHVEHCNQANQIIRTLETFFHVKRKYMPTRIPSVIANVFVEIHCQHRDNSGLLRT